MYDTLAQSNNRITLPHDVMTAIVASQNNETAAILLSQSNPMGVEHFLLFQ